MVFSYWGLDAQQSAHGTIVEYKNIIANYCESVKRKMIFLPLSQRNIQYRKTLKKKEQIMKKSIICIIVAAILLAMPQPARAAENGFTDVSPDDWFYEAVQFVKDEGLFDGMTPTTFAPNGTMTRAMFVQVLANQTINYEEPKAGENSLFMDVPTKAWYFPAVQWAARNKIVTGKEDGKFFPADEISREEMVKMLFNYAVMTGEVTSADMSMLDGYSDKGEIAAYARIPFAWAVSKGIISGTGGNKLAPKGKALRSHAAEMFQKAFPVLTKKAIVPAKSEPDDPSNDFLNALSLTFNQLTEGQTLTPVADIYGTLMYEGFAKYPDIQAYFVEGEQGMGPEYPRHITAPLSSVFPELIGKTLGEVFNILGGSAYLGENLETRLPTIEYITKGYIFEICLNAVDLTPDADKQVEIWWRGFSPPIEIPSDLKLTYEMNGRDIFNFTLPESWRDVILIEEHDRTRPTALSFHEPLTYARYKYLDGRLLYFYLQDTSLAPYWPMTQTVIKTVRFDEKEYAILAVFTSDIRWNISDPESNMAYHDMYADMGKLLDSVEVCAGIEIVEG